MKFEVTLAVLLAFLVPGIVFIWALPPALAESTGIIPNLGRPTTSTEVLVLLCSALVVGVFLDSIRVITVQPVVAWLARLFGEEGLPRDYISHVTTDRLPVFEMLVSRSYEYYRLNCNLAGGLFFSLFATLCVGDTGRRLFVLSIATVFSLAVSLRAKIDNDAALRHFVDSG